MSANELRKWLYREDLPCRKARELFFGPEGETSADRVKRIRMARTVCRGCPVNALCLEVAIANQEKFGIWAGHTPRELARYFQMSNRAA